MTVFSPACGISPSYARDACHLEQAGEAGFVLGAGSSAGEAPSDEVNRAGFGPSARFGLEPVQASGYTRALVAPATGHE